MEGNKRKEMMGSYKAMNAATAIKSIKIILPSVSTKG
jgi:hypothetical protein